MSSPQEDKVHGLPSSLSFSDHGCFLLFPDPATDEKAKKKKELKTFRGIPQEKVIVSSNLREEFMVDQ